MSNLPALPPTQPLDTDAGDIVLPRIKVGQPQSPAVMDDKVSKGSLFSTAGSDDEYPEELYKHGAKEGLLVHVLGLRKGKSMTVDNELHTWDFNDPDAPADARTTYDFHLYVPDYDTEVPYKFLLTSTATAAAKQIITVLKRNEARGPSYITAFRLTTKKREAEKNGQKFQWYVPVVTMVEADQAQVEAAGRIVGLINSAPAPALEQSTGDAPAI